MRKSWGFDVVYSRHLERVVSNYRYIALLYMYIGWSVFGGLFLLIALIPLQKFFYVNYKLEACRQN